MVDLRGVVINLDFKSVEASKVCTLGVALGDLMAGEDKGLREEDVVEVVAAEFGEGRTGDLVGVCVLLVWDGEPAEGVCVCVCERERERERERDKIINTVLGEGGSHKI